LQVTAKTVEVDIKGVGTINVHVEKFVPEKHTIESHGDYTFLIDGKPFFGSDGKIPSEKVSKILFSAADFTTELDVSAMFDPDINSDNIKMKIDAVQYWGQLYKVTGRFSDGAGTYIAEWIVTKDGSLRTHISDVESLYGLFSKMTDMYK
jgi:hypothetical protein